MPEGQECVKCGKTEFYTPVPKPWFCAFCNCVVHLTGGQTDDTFALLSTEDAALAREAATLLRSRRQPQSPKRKTAARKKKSRYDLPDDQEKLL